MVFFVSIYYFSTVINSVMKIKLSEWAAKNGIKYRTAWKWVRAGKMPEGAKVYIMPTGTILIEEV